MFWELLVLCQVTSQEEILSLLSLLGRTGVGGKFYNWHVNRDEGRVGLSNSSSTVLYFWLADRTRVSLHFVRCFLVVQTSKAQSPRHRTPFSMPCRFDQRFNSPESEVKILSWALKGSNESDERVELQDVRVSECPGLSLSRDCVTTLSTLWLSVCCHHKCVANCVTNSSSEGIFPLGCQHHNTVSHYFLLLTFIPIDFMISRVWMVNCPHIVSTRQTRYDKHRNRVLYVSLNGLSVSFNAENLIKMEFWESWMKETDSSLTSINTF